MTISSKELMERTGASYRQLDYWCQNGIIPTVGNSTPGSGNRRQFDEDVVDRIKLIAVLSRTFAHSLPKELLALILQQYDKGCFDLGEGVILSWEVNNEKSARRMRY